MKSLMGSFVVEDKKVENKVIEIIYQKREKENNFFILIRSNEIHLEISNTPPNLTVGSSVNAGDLWIIGDLDLNAMFFVYPYKEGKGNHKEYITVRFGGSRPDDINIYLPANHVAQILKR